MSALRTAWDISANELRRLRSHKEILVFGLALPVVIILPRGAHLRHHGIDRPRRVLAAIAAVVGLLAVRQLRRAVTG